MNKKNSNSGFTLVELAIVLVIIGLIVGGVLVGQDLIRAATIGKGTRQLTEVEAMVNSFRSKYNGIPGDVRNPTNIVSTIAGANAAQNRGDGDGLVEGVTNAGGTICATADCVSGEVAVFFREIAAGNFLSQTDTNNLTFDDMAAFTNTQAQINQNMFLPSPIAPGAMIMPASVTANARNYLIIRGPASGVAVAGAAPTTVGAMKPADGAAFDAKLDDGVPSTGNVMAVALTGGAPATVIAGAAGGCVNAAGAYNSTVTTNLCAISYRANF